MSKALIQLPRKYLNPREASEYLGVSLRTMRLLLARREIEYTQYAGRGGMIRIAVSDLDAFMERNKVHCVGNA